MQKRTEPQAQGNEGRVLPMRYPLEEAPDGEEPDEGGTHPGSEVSRSQSSRHLLRLSIGAVADVRNQAQGKLRNNAATSLVMLRGVRLEFRILKPIPEPK